MKVFLLSALLAILVAFAGAVSSEQKPVVVSYPKDTPQSVLDEAMAAIKKAGGVITHEYSLIKGFAAEACTEALDTVQTMGKTNNVMIEEDMMFHTTDNE